MTGFPGFATCGAHRIHYAATPTTAPHDQDFTTARRKHRAIQEHGRAEQRSFESTML